MPDIVPADVRSRMMAGIRSTNTKPEIMLRHGLHAIGFRFRLHDRRLPGNPDIVFPKHRAVIFAHGCFWHGHDCHLFRLPGTRPDFWQTKITRNRDVDIRATDALHLIGWRQGIVWECALRGKLRQPLADVIEQCAAWLRTDIARLEIRGHA